MRIPEAQLAKAVGELQKEGKMSESELAHAVIAFMQRKRLGRRASKIVRALGEYVESELGSFAVGVTSARPLSTEERHMIKTEAATLLGKPGQSVMLNFHEDPGVIGGVRFETADVRYDGTVARAIRELRKSL